MSDAARAAVIAQYCKELKLPSMQRSHEGLGRQARDGGWPYEEYLHQLLEAEVQARHESAMRRLLREARFADFKTLEQIDWQAMKGVSRPKVLELASCTSSERRTWSSPVRSARARPTWRSAWA